MSIDEHAKEQLHGNRFKRVLGMINDIGRFLNVESHAKKALDWLTQQFKNSLWATWKSLVEVASAVSAKVQKVLGFGPDEEPPPGSIMLLDAPPSDGTIPIF